MYVTLKSALSIRLSVGWLVGWLVMFYFFYDFISLTPLLLPKWSTSNMAPAHPHATSVAVHPALFFINVRGAKQDRWRFDHWIFGQGLLCKGLVSY